MPVWSQSEYDSNNGKITPTSVDDYLDKIQELKNRGNAIKKDGAEPSNTYSSNRKKRLVERMHNATGDEAVRLATLIYNEFYRASRSDADSDESSNGWVTMNGTHVLVGEEGENQNGPPALKGKKYSEAKSQRKSSTSQGGGKAPATSESKTPTVSAKKAQYKAKLQAEKDDLLKKSKGQQALTMMDKGYLTHAEAIAAMKDGSITAKIDDYYAIMEENGDPTSEKPLSKNKNTNNQDVQSGKYSDYDEARKGYIKEKTGLTDEECNQIYEQTKKWVGNYWNKADTAQLDKFVENDHTCEGEIYRGLHFIEGYDEMSFDDFMKDVQIGGTITNAKGRNSSWSSSEDVARQFSHKQDKSVDSVMIRCVSNRTSSPIAALNTQGELEVLAHSRAQWTVLNVEQYDKGEGGRHAVITVVETGEYAPPERGDGIVNGSANDNETQNAKPMSLEDRWSASNADFKATPRESKSETQ